MVGAADSAPARSSRLLFVWTALIIAAAQAVLYLIDPRPRFYFGDSESYLATAVFDFVPPDRSYLYGYVIKWATAWSGDLAWLVLLQIAMLSVSALFVLLILRRHFATGPVRAAVISGAVAVLPVHVLWTRFVLAESAALLALTTFLLAALEYVRRRSVLSLIPLHVVGVIGIAIRLVMLPAVWLAAIALPLLALGIRRPRALAIHLIVSLGCMGLCHGLYCWDYARRLERSSSVAIPRPSYTYASGFVWLSLLAPRLQAEDFPAEVDGGALLRASAPPVANFRSREAQRWVDGGLVNQLIQAVDDDDALHRRAEALAGEAARRALFRDPFALIDLGLRTLADYWDDEQCRWATRRDLMIGRGPSPGFREMLRLDWGLELAAEPVPPGPLEDAYLAMRWYLVFLTAGFLLVPLMALAQDHHTRRSFWVLTVVTIYYGLAAGFLAPAVIPRYLEPVSWLLLVALGAFRWRVEALPQSQALSST
ncbi:MAG: hypothetical protein AAF628_27605 [Planctomycetota bacterium]